MNTVIVGPLIVRRLSIALLFEPRDAWFGLYIDPYLDAVFDRGVRVYVCLLPFLPVLFTWTLGPRRRTP